MRQKPSTALGRTTAALAADSETAAIPAGSRKDHDDRNASVIQGLFDPAFALGTKAYIKSHCFSEYSADVIAAVHANTTTMPPGRSQMYNLQLGGAVARVPEDATAFGDRSAGFLGMFVGVWDDDGRKEGSVAWSRGFSEAILPLSLGGTYLNLADAETEPDWPPAMVARSTPS